MDFIKTGSVVLRIRATRIAVDVCRKVEERSGHKGDQDLRKGDQVDLLEEGDKGFIL